MELPLLYLVTDRHRCGGRRLEDVVEAAVEGGVRAVQLREKNLSNAEESRLSLHLREVTRGRALLFINNRIDLAVTVQAEGVHLPEVSRTVASVRQGGPVEMLVGKSVHSVEGGIAATSEGADLLIAGTVFPTSSHPDREPQGVVLLEQLNHRVQVPCLAIGGVTVENVKDVIDAGASGIAVVTAITESNDPGCAARRLRESMQKAWLERSITVKVPLG